MNMASTNLLNQELVKQSYITNDMNKLVARFFFVHSLHIITSQHIEQNFMARDGTWYDTIYRTFL